MNCHMTRNTKPCSGYCIGVLFFVSPVQQLADSYDKLVQDLHNEQNWVSDIEQLLKDDQPVSDEAYKAQAQVEALKVSTIQQVIWTLQMLAFLLNINNCTKFPYLQT